MKAEQIEAARRALRCLYLEVPESVGDDVIAKVEAAFSALLSELASLRSEREGMREGLKPFAREADEWWDELPDSYVPGTVEAGVVYPGMAGGDAKYTVGDLRRARALLLQGETP